MIDVKCKGCGNLLFKCEFAYVAIKCRSCKKIFEYKIISNLTINEQYDKFSADSTENKPQKG